MTLNIDGNQLLDCAHVGQFSGICQYEGCANRICGDCVATCDLCLVVLCPPHQILPDDDDITLCPEHITQYRINHSIDRIVDRL